MDNLIIIVVKLEYGEIIKIEISPNKKIKDILDIIKKKAKCRDLDLKFKDKLLDPSLTIYKSGLKNNDLIISENEEYLIEEGMEPEDINLKEINIKFLKLLTGSNVPNYNIELTSLLKLCLLKEISSKIEQNKLEKLPDIIRLILKILKKDYECETSNLKGDIKKILEKVKGSNIINFSKFVDNTVDSTQLNSIINLLNKKDFSEIKDIKNRLARYEKDIKIFDKDFSEAMKDSIIEFSIVSLAIIEREDFEKFEMEKKNCENRVDKLLFHGTGIEPVSSILTGYFRKSQDRCYQHGKGVYFSDKLDYCWFYGNKDNNRINRNKIPYINETFTLIACSTYYDKYHRKHVYDYKYDPKKNEINFAYADSEFETLVDFDEKKFYGTEYVIWDLDQICPFIGAKLKRVEFCCIWRDNNFSQKPVYNNEFDDIFKKFLAERMRYIEQYADFNIYPCQTSEEALKLIKRKKYNKIILLSNIGTDFGGKKFIDEARKIIGNDVIVLFSAYNIEHIKWVKDYKNALFSNDPYFYEQYLKCFSGYNQPKFSEKDIKNNILTLKKKMEDYYKVKFNFDNDFISYPHFKKEGKYSDLFFD